MGWDCNQREFRTGLFATIGTAGTTLFATERIAPPVANLHRPYGVYPSEAVNVKQFCCFIRVVLANLSRYHAKV